MTKFNRDLIFLYSENVRAKLKDLSSKLNKTPQRLKYSISALESQKIVYNPYCIFDYAYLNLLLFRVYFKSSYVSDKDKEEIIRKLVENNYITSIYELSGEFDLAIEILAPNPSRFNRELRKIISYLPSLNKFKVVLNLLTNIYPKSYLISNAHYLDGIKKEIIIGGDKEKLSFNDNELNVIKCLLDNPSARLASLAIKSGLNVKTVNTILKDLKNKKLVKACKHIVDTDKLDIHKFRLFLKINHINREKSLRLTDFMLKTNEIVQMNKTVGDWDIEIDIESGNKETVRKLIAKIREDFKDIIEDFNSMEFYKYYKRSYLPKYLFE